MNPKALSPLIATLLLVVFVMGLSAIVITWSTPMAQDNLENSDKLDYDLKYCATARADIISVLITPANKTTVNIQNFGDAPLNLSEATIHNKNYQSCTLMFDDSYLDVGDFATATNISCPIITNCSDFLLVDVKTECAKLIVRYNTDLKASNGGGCGS